MYHKFMLIKKSFLWNLLWPIWKWWWIYLNCTVQGWIQDFPGVGGGGGAEGGGVKAWNVSHCERVAFMGSGKYWTLRCSIVHYELTCIWNWHILINSYMLSLMMNYSWKFRVFFKCNFINCANLKSCVSRSKEYKEDFNSFVVHGRLTYISCNYA